MDAAWHGCEQDILSWEGFKLTHQMMGCSDGRRDASRKGSMFARLDHHMSAYIHILAMASGSQTLRDDCRPRLCGARR